MNKIKFGGVIEANFERPTGNIRWVKGWQEVQPTLQQEFEIVRDHKHLRFEWRDVESIFLGEDYRTKENGQ